MADDPPTQERLWLTEPGRSTCLAEVQAIKGSWLLVDRALFAPRSRALRHPQVPDKGRVWVEGDKRRLAAVKEQSGRVWIRLRDVVPSVGATLQCELDNGWRDTASRAHTALHLLLTAGADLGLPPLVADPEVKGDGHVRLTFRDFVAPEMMARMRERVLQDVRADRPVSTRFVPRAEAERDATPQRFQPPGPVPGGDVVPLVTIEERCAHPCDGTHMDRTGRITDMVVPHARPAKDGFVVVVRVT